MPVVVAVVVLMVLLLVLMPQVFENELRVYAEEGIEVKVSAAVYTSSCLRMLTGKRDGVLPM